jgi:hypothetical protein
MTTARLPAALIRLMKSVISGLRADAKTTIEER